MSQKITNLTNGEKTFIRLMATALHRRKTHLLKEKGEAVVNGKKAD